MSARQQAAQRIIRETTGRAPMPLTHAPGEVDD
jgi:hypothetical protein